MKGLCEQCRDMVGYSVKIVQKTKDIKGKKINYQGKEAYCDKSASNIFVADIRDYNLEKLDEAYRKGEDIILVSDIEKILEKYNVGKRPLSLLLGWGEITLTRYLNGDIPSKQYSDTLKKVLNEPEYFRELLEINKEKVTDNAYSFCKNALEEISSTVEPETEVKFFYASNIHCHDEPYHK